MIDLQRKSNRQKQLIQAIASEQEETIDLKEDIDNHLLLMQFWAFLKPKERQMWLDWVNQEGSKTVSLLLSSEVESPLAAIYSRGDDKQQK